MRNGTFQRDGYVAPPKDTEMPSYDTLPPEIRAVIRDAPFEVSATDMQANRLVMAALEDRGADAPKWLKEQLEKVYRERILPAAMN